MWRRFEAEGAEWEVRSIPNSADVGDQSGAASQEVLEFRANDANRPPRRLVVETGAGAAMDEEELRNALRQARPIGGDFYGRPGKKMGDVAGQ